MHGFQGSRRPARPPEKGYDDAVQLGENTTEEGTDGSTFHPCHADGFISRLGGMLRASYCCLSPFCHVDRFFISPPGGMHRTSFWLIFSVATPDGFPNPFGDMRRTFL